MIVNWRAKKPGLRIDEMMKEAILKLQLQKCHNAYEKRLETLSDPYGMWIKGTESRRIGESLEEYCQGRYLAVTVLDGIPRVPVCRDFEAQNAGLIYGDEDLYDPVLKKRYGSWMKPEYSPDTLLSFFYFGSMVLLDKRYIKEAVSVCMSAWEEKKPGYERAAGFCQRFLLETGEKGIIHLSKEDRSDYYEFVLFYCEFLVQRKLPICHVPEILFHTVSEGWQPENILKPEVVNEAAYWGYEPRYSICKENALLRRGIKGSIKLYEKFGRGYGIAVYDVTDEPLVSVVILSKDNVEVLSVCLKSLVEKTEYKHYEIIVVDNGSTSENRAEVEFLQKQYGFYYLYSPCSFNFSKMCNLGAEAANGDYLLLLNDDIEIIQPDWMTVMLGQAMQSHVGAVGAKLLYPGTDKIQHAGISNLLVGPVHKLSKEPDTMDYYYGRNILPYDMIGVTAACLMISKQKYEKIGGFCEEVAVSYNDVDFCFSLYERGYYHVQRCDVTALHHESVSRGSDYLSAEKWKRLLLEKDYVYSRHKSLIGKDPFYNPNLAGYKYKYFCNYLYPYEQREAFQKPKPYRKRIPGGWHNNCLTVTIEHIGLERKLDSRDMRDVYWMEGWAYVLGMDSARYDKLVLLTDKEENCFYLKPFERYRPDVVEILPEQIHVELSGFYCRIQRNALKAGAYSVAVLFRDKCSRQRLYKQCDEILMID